MGKFLVAIHDEPATAPFVITGEPTTLAHMKRIFFDSLRLGRFDDGRIRLNVEFADRHGNELKWTPGWDDLCELATAAYKTEYSNEGGNQNTRRLATAIYWSERGRQRWMKRREWGRIWTRCKALKMAVQEVCALPSTDAGSVQTVERGAAKVIRRVEQIAIQLDPNREAEIDPASMAYCIECDWHAAPDECSECDVCGPFGEPAHQGSA